MPVLRGSLGRPFRWKPAERGCIALLAVPLATGCIPRTLPHDAYDRGTVEVPCCEVGKAPVELTYLGVGGWLIRRGDASLLTAPFFSNPHLLEVGLERIHPDPDRIAAHLPDVADVSAILVGHGHYDHLMDVPWILEHRAPRAVVLGNRTVAHQLAPSGFGRVALEEGRDGALRPSAPPPDAPAGAGGSVVVPDAPSPDRGPPAAPTARVVVVGPVAGTPTRPGRWIRVAEGVRVMALVSDHAPHVAGVTLYSGRRTRDMPEPPASAEEWLAGQTLAWLVDLVEPDGSVAFRIYYQDAAGAAPWGLVPPLGDGVAIDVALLVPATYSGTVWHPEAILENTSPRHVILGHWEDFFEPPSRPAGPVPFTLLPDFVARLARALPEGARYDVPVPGTRFVFR